MMQKPWFKIFIWIVTSSFFFVASIILIATFNPSPTENEVMQFMMGMMGAMENSMMGLSMSLGEDNVLMPLILAASSVTLPLIATAILAALFIRIRRS
jgi:hypothetical protein